MSISEKELKAFICLAEQQHFAKASELLNMTPSALSRLIQRLEADLEVTLFNRDKRSVVMSQVGLTFLNYARESLSRLDEVKSTLQADKNQIKGSLSLYCSVTAAYSVLTELLPSIRNNYPDIDVLLRTGDASNAVERVQTGQEQMAITAKPRILPKQLLYKEITSSHLSLIISKSDCIVRQNWLKDKSKWQDLPWILSESGIIRQEFDRWAGQQKLKVNVYNQVSGHEAIVSMVSLGFGIGLVPDIVLQYSPQRNDVEKIPIKIPLPDLSIGVCVQKKTLLQESIKAVWGLL